MFERVEGGDADRIVKLPGEEVGDDGFDVGPLDLDFAAGTLPARRSTTR